MSKQSRRHFDDDNFVPPVRLAIHQQQPELDDEITEPSWSSYNDDGVLHGPQPLPPWVITSSDAIDDDLGVMKTGKEADVSLIRRDLDGRSTLLAAKRYRNADHRMFHRDAGYLEGRKEKKSRERRAMETRTEFGRELIAGRWAQAEFDVLCQLWSAGAAVPYPVQLSGTELMMEFIGSPAGVAAPRLAQIRPGPQEAANLFEQMRVILGRLAEIGYAHGDLSAYNVLVDDGRLVLIDLPQAIDLVGNPRGPVFMRRDCDNICSWFGARGVLVDAAALCDELLDRSW